MFRIQVALLVLFSFNYCYCASTRVWHSKNCGKKGFTCVPGNKTLIYECPVKTKEYHIYVNEFNRPANLESLIIRNCKTLTVLLRCTTRKQERKKLNYLKVANIERLKIQNVQNYHSQLPPKVIFEDIKFIEKVPSYSFSQVDKRLNKARCILPAQDFNSLYFRNVTINAINTHAFYMPNKFGNVTFTEVRINNMDTLSVIVNHGEGGVFLLNKSTVQTLKPFSFQITGKRATFSESKFIDIPPSGINATIETFNFFNNSVKTLHSRALSILASNVFILNNRFDSLKAGAFEQIGRRIFGALKFTYDFSRNDINFMDAGCLHPDLISHESVASEISFSSNRLSCACDKLDWLFSTLDRDDMPASKIAFYKMLFDEKNENICSSSCNLPLVATRGMIKNGNCMQNVTIQWLCDNKDKSTSPSPSDIYRSTNSIGESTMTPARSNSIIIINNSSLKVLILPKKTSNAFRTLGTSHSKLTTAVVRLPILETTIQPLNRISGEPTYTSARSEQPVKSSLTSNSIVSNSSAPSSPFSNSVVTSASEETTNFFIGTSDVNLFNKTSTALRALKFGMSHNKLTTAAVDLPILRTTKRGFSSIVGESTYTPVKYEQTESSVWVDNSVASNSDVTSSSFVNEGSEIKTTAFDEPVLSVPKNKVHIPESLKFVNSAENYFVCLLLIFSTLCIVIST